MSDEIQQEFQSLLEGTGETAKTPDVEAMDYFLDGKPNKLPLTSEFQFNEDGKVTKVPLSTIVNHYRQRAELDRKFGQLKKDREGFETERGDATQWAEARKRLEPLEKWSRENPDEFEHIWQLYENRDKHILEKQAANGTEPLVQRISELSQKLKDLEGFKSQFESSEEQKRNERALVEVNTEADTFQKEWPEINLGEKDAEGIELRRQIIAYGVREGLPTFRAAALMMLQPRLIDTAQKRARDQAVKGVKAENSAGVVARSSTPFNGQSASPRNTSWGKTAENAKAELANLLRGQTS